MQTGVSAVNEICCGFDANAAHADPTDKNHLINVNHYTSGKKHKNKMNRGNCREECMCV